MPSLLRCLLIVVVAASLGSCDQLERARRGWGVLLKQDQQFRQRRDDGRQAAARRATRAQRGDTLSLPAEQLARYLPAVVAGFTPAGSDVAVAENPTGAGYSLCTRQFARGSEMLMVQLFDFNGAYARYPGRSPIMAPGYALTTRQQRIRAWHVGLPNVQASEIVAFQPPSVSVLVGIADRFYLTVAQTGGRPDASTAKAVVQQVNLAALSAL